MNLYVQAILKGKLRIKLRLISLNDRIPSLLIKNLIHINVYLT